LPCAKVIDDVTLDAPKAFQLFAIMIKGVLLDNERKSRLTSKSMHSRNLLSLCRQEDKCIQAVRVVSSPLVQTFTKARIQAPR
jgi:hypothetical protein